MQSPTLGAPLSLVRVMLSCSCGRTSSSFCLKIVSFGSASSILLTLSNDEGASLTYYEYCILLYMIIYYI
jgi:hypothetical protein